MKTKLTTVTTLAIGSCLASSQALAVEPVPPRGTYIKPLAAHCAIGPFEKLGKAGEYNQYCHVLTDAEKCLAHVKYAMDLQGELNPTFERARTEYCLETFRKGLLEE